MTSASPAHTKHFDFSKRAIEQLPSSSKGVTYYYDLKVKGLALSVGISGRKAFLLYRKIKGRPTRVKIGLFPDLSVEQARREATVMNANIALGTIPHRHRSEPRHEMTLAQLFERYYAEHSSLRKTSHREDLQKFQLHVDTQAHGINLAKLPLSEVTRARLTAHHARMGAAIPTTANRVLALISSMFTKAIQWGAFDGLNPCRGIEKFKERSRTRFVQPDEMPRLLAAMEAESNTNIRDFVQLALYTGARRTNLLSMKWADVHMGRCEWHIPRTKNGEPQTVPLTHAAMDVLRSRREEANLNASDFVFPGPGKRGHFAEPKTAWARVTSRATALGLMDALAEKCMPRELDLKRAREEAIAFPKEAIERCAALAASKGIHIAHFDMRDLHIHDLRRTLGSWLASGGTSLPIIGKALNHKSPEATKVYARLMLGPVRDAMEAATGAMQRAGQQD